MERQPLNCFPPHTALHEPIYPLDQCPSNAVLHLQVGARACNVILPHLSLTHVFGSVGNASRGPWLPPSMLLAPCQNSQSMNWASLGAQMVKNLPAMQETRFSLWVRKIPWRREWQPTPVLLPGECHGHRSLVGYSPRGRQESDTSD